MNYIHQGSEQLVRMDSRSRTDDIVLCSIDSDQNLCSLQMSLYCKQAFF